MTGLADVTKTKLAADFGAATGGSATTLQDMGKAWRVNHYVGYLLELVKAQTGVAYFSMISANTATQLTFSALPVTVSPGDVYYIREGGSPHSANLIRWGRNVAPAWVHAAEVVAPLAAAVLVTQAVGAGVSGYIYGFFVSVGEGNDFLVNWVSATVAYSKRLVFGAGGTVETIDQVPMNEGLPADTGTNITITNVNAGGVGIVYQACLLYAEA
jgi:hypothetical protein